MQMSITSESAYTFSSMIKKGIYIFLLVVLLSCSEDQAFIDIIPEKLTLVGREWDFGFVNEQSDPIVLQVLFRDSIPVAGAEVNITINSGRADLIVNNLVSDQNGLIAASAVYTDTGRLVLQATMPSLDTTVFITREVGKSRVTNFSKVSGDNQESLNRQLLEEPFVVSVSDDFGNLSQDIPVKFVVEQGNGLLDSGSEQLVKTNSEGEAEVLFEIGDSPLNVISATLPNDSTLTFTVFALSPSPITSLTQSENGVSISWTPSTVANFSKQKVHRSTYNDFRFEEVLYESTQRNVTEFIDDSAVPGTTYYYAISTQTAQENSVSSSPESILFGDILTLAHSIGDMLILENNLYMTVPSKNRLDIMDINSREYIEQIDIGSIPTKLFLDEESGLLYVGLGGSGALAIYDTHTAQIKVITIIEELFNPLVWDIHKVADDRIWISGNPQQFGTSTIVELNLENDSIRRVSNLGGIRHYPSIEARLNEYAFVSEGDFNRIESTIKVDLATEEILIERDISARNSTAGANSAFEFKRSTNVIFYESGLVLSAETLDEVTNLNIDGIPTLSKDQELVYYLSTEGINVFNTSNYQLEKSLPVNMERLLISGLSEQESTIVIYGTIKTGRDLLFLNHSTN